MDYEKIHRELWGWLVGRADLSSEYCMDTKRQWPGWERQSISETDASLMNYCSACMACEWNCRQCPIDWRSHGERGCPCEYNDSPYQDWRNATEPAERARLAAIIRDMPWKEIP